MKNQRQTLVIVEKTTLAAANAGSTGFELMVTGPRAQRHSLESSTDLQDWTATGLVSHSLAHHWQPRWDGGLPGHHRPGTRTLLRG